MLNGEQFDSRDDELLELYHQARAYLQELHKLSSRNIDERNLILSKLLGEKGEGVWIEAPFRCEYGQHIFIGMNTFVNTNCVFLDNNRITIGKNGLIGPGVHIYTASHPIRAEARVPQYPEKSAPYVTTAHPVVIGDNVWIGGGSIIMPGITIGSNVTIGAGSLVTSDIPGNVLAFGHPCKVHKTL